jgi:hypothetical protein
MRGVFKLAHRSGFIENNIMAMVENRKIEKPTIHPLSMDEVNKFLECVLQNSWQAINLVDDTKSGSAFLPSDNDAIAAATGSRVYPYISGNVVENYDTTGTNIFSTISTLNKELDAFGNFALKRERASDGIHRQPRPIYTKWSFFIKYYSIAFSILPGLAGGLAW